MWDEGYTSEINYTSGYYPELAPSRLKLALLSRGIDHSVPRSPRYLELGFGQGLSLAINSATNSGVFEGTDFNPGQVANAQELAQAAGKAIALFEDSFEEFGERSDIRPYDIIALHGIWSWISDASRQAIVEIARRKLKPGGVLYISYNVTPGWSPAWPLRNLLSEYSRREASGRLLDRVEESLAFVEKVINSDAAYFRQNPQLKARLETMRKQDRTYVAHEYFNANWDPMPFSTIADRLAEAKLTFAASANILENLPAISVPNAGRAVLDGIKDPVMRETVRDYFVNQQFRRDIFVKGARTIASYELARRIQKEPFLYVGSAEGCPQKISTVVGEVELRGDIYKPVYEALVKAGENAVTIEELKKNKSLDAISVNQLWEALLVLTGAGHVSPVSTSDTPDEDATASRTLNACLVDRAEADAGVEFLAAPRLGAATKVPRIEQLFIRYLMLDDKDVVGSVWAVLKAQKQHLIVAGKALQGDEANLKELRRMFDNFKGKREKHLKKLGVF